MIAIDPLRREYSRSTLWSCVLRQPLWRANETQPLMPLVELVHVRRLLRVVQLLPNAFLDKLEARYLINANAQLNR